MKIKARTLSRILACSILSLSINSVLAAEKADKAASKHPATPAETKYEGSPSAIDAATVKPAAAPPSPCNYP